MMSSGSGDLLRGRTPRETFNLVFIISLLLNGLNAFALEKSADPVRNCLSVLWQVGQTRVIPFETPIKITRHLGKTLFYPLVALSKMARFAVRGLQDRSLIKEARTKFVQNVRKDIFHGVAYLGLVMAAQMTSLPYHQFDNQLNIQMTPQARVVVVNAYPEAEKLREFVDYRFDSRYAKMANAEKLVPQDWNSMLLGLKESVAAHGKIHLLELHGHGVPGTFVAKSDATNGETLRQYLNSDTPHSAEGKGAKDIVTLCHSLVEQGIMEKNGVIVIYGCSSGYGPEGKSLMVSVGHLLAPDGARVYSSEIMVTSSLLDQLYLNAGTKPPSVAAYFRDALDVGLPIVRLTREMVSSVSTQDAMSISMKPVRELAVAPTR